MNYLPHLYNYNSIRGRVIIYISAAWGILTRHKRNIILDLFSAKYVPTIEFH